MRVPLTQVRADYAAADGTLNTSSHVTTDQAQALAATEVQAFAGGSFAHLQEHFEALVQGATDPGRRCGKPIGPWGSTRRTPPARR